MIHTCTENATHKKDKEWDCEMGPDCGYSKELVCKPCATKLNAKLTAERTKAGYKAKPPAKKAAKKKKPTKKRPVKRRGRKKRGAAKRSN